MARMHFTFGFGMLGCVAYITGGLLSLPGLWIPGIAVAGICVFMLVTE